MSINEVELDFDCIMLVTLNVNQSLTRSCHQIRRTWKIVLREKSTGRTVLLEYLKIYPNTDKNNFIGLLDHKNNYEDV